MQQLLLFDPQIIKSEIDQEYILEKYERLRKSQHARITGLQKDIKELKSEMEFLKSHICRDNLFVN